MCVCAYVWKRKEQEKKKTQDGAQQQWTASSLRHLRIFVPKALPKRGGHSGQQFLGQLKRNVKQDKKNLLHPD